VILAKGYPDSEALWWWFYDHFLASPDWAPGIPALLAWPLLVLAFCGVVVSVRQFASKIGGS
jgi:hypothetical protein